MICRACQQPTRHLQAGVIFGVNIQYFDCPACGYVQTETPFWLDQAYAEAINDSDTGIMARNQANARIVLGTLWVLGHLNGRLVDCAGGYGILVRLLRDMGVDAFWSDRYCKNLVARGFEHVDGQADLVTAFEAFEHFVNPQEELDRLLGIGSSILFSTELIANPAPRQKDWWYYGKEHGQHIGFFRMQTLKKLAQDRGKVLLSNGTSYHLITDKPVSEHAWKFVVKFNRLVPFLLIGRLQSKVWPDFEQMAALKK